MGCITDCLRQHGEYWKNAVTEAWTTRPGGECRCFPEANRQGVWEIPNIYEAGGRSLAVEQLDPVKCKVVAEHLKEDANWERVKVGLCIVGALIATAVAVTYMIALASVVLLLSAAAFEALLACAIELIGQSILLTAVAAGVGGFVFVAEGIFLAGLSGMALGEIWAQVFGPNIQNGRNHAVFLENTAQDLQIRFLQPGE